MTDVSRERMAAQLLTGPPASAAVDVVERLLAVQAQDPRGARLAIRARSVGLVAGDVDRGLTQDRTLLISWLNRGTLHRCACAAKTILGCTSRDAATPHRQHPPPGAGGRRRPTPR